jgi:ribonuclease HI
MEVLDNTHFQSVIQDPFSKITIVSDGGVYNYQGNFGVIMACKGHPLMINYGKLYSIEFYESSFRSELYGVLAGLVTFNYICKELQVVVPEGKEVNLFCDNKSVVNKISSRQELRRTVNQHRHPDVDIEMQVLHEVSLLEKEHLNFTIQHVQGHQDTTKLKRSLTMEEHLNVEADKLTHKARELPDQRQYHRFPMNPVNFILNNRYIDSNYPRVVNTAFHSIALWEYFSSKYGWLPATIESIWWQTYHRSITKLPSPDKQRIHKFINNKLPTMRRHAKYYHYKSSLCPCCKAHVENEDHVLRCRIPSRQHIRNEWRKAVTEYLSKAHTPPEVKYYICHGFFSWLKNGRPHPFQQPKRMSD